MELISFVNMFKNFRFACQMWSSIYIFWFIDDTLIHWMEHLLKFLAFALSANLVMLNELWIRTTNPEHILITHYE